MGVYSTPDLGDLLTARIDDITNATNIPVSFQGWLGNIGVVLEGRIEGQLCVEDGFLSGLGHMATFGNKLVCRSRMVDLR